MVAVQQKILKLLKESSLQPTWITAQHPHPKHKLVQTYCVCTVTAHKLNVALGFHPILKEINRLYLQLSFVAQ